MFFPFCSLASLTLKVKLTTSTGHTGHTGPCPDLSGSFMEKYRKIHHPHLIGSCIPFWWILWWKGLHLHCAAKNAMLSKYFFQDLSISLLLMLPSQAPEWQHRAQNNDLGHRHNMDFTSSRKTTNRHVSNENSSWNDETCCAASRTNNALIITSKKCVLARHCKRDERMGIPADVTTETSK